MKLYEIDEKLDALMERLKPDEDGVYDYDPDETMTEIENLNLQKEEILKWMAKKILNNKAEASALKEEQKRLYSRQKRLENQSDRLMKILELRCEGKKTDLGVATVSYRKTEATEIYDTQKLTGWLIQNGYLDCVRMKEPEISKTELKKLIQKAKKDTPWFEVPWCDVVERISCSLK